MSRAVTLNRQVMSILVATIFVAASLFVYSSPVYGRETDKRPTETAIDECYELEQKLNELLDSFVARRDSHMTKYDELAGLYQDIIDSLEKANYRVALLYELSPGLQRRAVFFASTSEVFLSELTDVRDSACRDSKSFEQELEEARTALKDVQSAVNDIEEYVRTVLLTSVESVVLDGNGS